MTRKLIPVNVTLDRQGPEALATALAKLKAAGLQDPTVLEAIGVVTGRVARERLGRLKEVPGVAVEADETIDIGPPDAPIK